MFTLEARENPFFPSAGEKDLPFTSNESTKLPQLKRASIKLPSHARVIKKVSIEYESLDASVENKSIELNHSIDWHLPVFISQSYTDENANEETKVTTIIKETKKAVRKYKKVGTIKHANFFISNKSLKIITKDNLLRNFLLGQPHRIVMDFKKDSNLKTYVKQLENSVFTKIRVGNHKGYYRVVVELDGYYRYKLKKQPDGCLITLH
mgnify:CR=1 FL=1